MNINFRNLEEKDMKKCLNIMQENYEEKDGSFYSRSFLEDFRDVFLKDTLYKSNCRLLLIDNEIV